MKPIEYLKKTIIDKLISIGAKSAQYEYHDYSETHFIRLIPGNIVDSDRHNIELSNFIIDFEDKFEGEMLCFIGESSLTKLEDPEELMTFEGVTYMPPILLQINYEKVLTADFIREFLHKRKERKDSVNIFISMSNSSAIDIFPIKKNDYSLSKYVAVAAEPEGTYLGKGELNYCLAA